MGVIRHADAGYEQASAVAAERGVRVPDGDMSFARLWRELEPLGRDPATGGYRRYSWTAGRRGLPRLVHRPGRAARPGRRAR